MCGTANGAGAFAWLRLGQTPGDQRKPVSPSGFNSPFLHCLGSYQVFMTPSKQSPGFPVALLLVPLTLQPAKGLVSPLLNPGDGMPDM